MHPFFTAWSWKRIWLCANCILQGFTTSSAPKCSVTMDKCDDSKLRSLQGFTTSATEELDNWLQFDQVCNATPVTCQRLHRDLFMIWQCHPCRFRFSGSPASQSNLEAATTCNIPTCREGSRDQHSGMCRLGDNIVTELGDNMLTSIRIWFPNKKYKQHIVALVTA